MATRYNVRVLGCKVIGVRVLGGDDSKDDILRVVKHVINEMEMDYMEAWEVKGRVEEDEHGIPTFQPWDDEDEYHEHLVLIYEGLNWEVFTK